MQATEIQSSNLFVPPTNSPPPGTHIPAVSSVASDFVPMLALPLVIIVVILVALLVGSLVCAKSIQCSRYGIFRATCKINGA